MTTAQVGYAPVHRWVKYVLGRTHTTVVVTVAWAVVVSPRGATRHCGRSGSCLTSRARWFWSVVPAAGAALVARAGARSGGDQSSADPPGSHAPGSGSARGGGAGHDPARALGRLVGGHRHRWSHAPHRLGRHPLSLAPGTLPGHDAGAHPAASGRLRPWCAGRWWRTAAFPARRFLRSCAKAVRTSACGCG
jgi:hypothetical protein